MWGDILSMALVVSLNPVLLAFILLVISRPRPIPNLVAFWIGALIVNVPAFLVPVLVLHAVPSFSSMTHDLVAPDPSTGVKPLQLVLGLLWLVVAGWLGVRIRRQKRIKQAAAVRAGGDSSVLVLESDESTDPADQAPGRVRGMVSSIVGPIQRGFHRLHEAWDGGALWVSLIFGMGYLPPPPLVLVVAALIGGSGLAIGTQAVASVVFVFTMLAVFELALLSYVIAPHRTSVALKPLHEWTRDHRLLVLAVLFAAIGVWQVLKGVGLL